MNQDKARAIELTRILLLMAEGLRSKAAVIKAEAARGDTIRTCPSEVLLSAAYELQVAAGASLDHHVLSSLSTLVAERLEIVINNQLQIFVAEKGPAGTLDLQLDQQLDQLRDPAGNVICQRPKGMHVRLVVTTSPNAISVTGDDLDPGSTH